MPLINIAKDDINPLFIDPSDITALRLDKSGTRITLYNSQGRLLDARLQDVNLDVADVVQKLQNSGVPLLPFTMRHDGKEYSHYISPRAVTYATISLPGKDGMVGAIVGVKGVGRVETWEGGTTQSEIDNLIDAVKKNKTLFAYEPKEAYSRWFKSAALYIDPTSVTRMQGRFNDDQIDVFFDNGGSLDVQVAYHNQFSPETSFEQEAIDIYSAKKYTGTLQGIPAIKDIIAQLEKAAFQARVDFVNKIAAANSNLLNISTQTQAAFLRREDISTVSLYETSTGGESSLFVKSKEKQQGFGDEFRLQFNTAAERQTALAVLLQGNTSQAKSKPDLKP